MGPTAPSKTGPGFDCTHIKQVVACAALVLWGVGTVWRTHLGERFLHAALATAVLVTGNLVAWGIYYLVSKRPNGLAIMIVGYAPGLMDVRPHEPLSRELLRALSGSVILALVCLTVALAIRAYSKLKSRNSKSTLWDPELDSPAAS